MPCRAGVARPLCVRRRRQRRRTRRAARRTRRVAARIAAQRNGDKHPMKRRKFGFAVAGAALAPWHAIAQAWPDKPVKWVLSQPPGSGPDTVARLLSDRLQKTWGQAVVIENKPGGQNTIGAQAAARSPADGYNFYFATTAALVTNPLLFKT